MLVRYNYEAVYGRLIELPREIDWQWKPGPF
jgi:hypothetical protein